ncbi:hypothetical protein [Knoellia sp. 3-2P3]|nr:hypothetical protein [Knoellia sp. 3-2P3]
MFVLNLLWLRDPDPPGPRWQSVLILIAMIVLGVVTVRRWRREDTTAIS